jgi:hypothetical protein
MHGQSESDSDWFWIWSESDWSWIWFWVWFWVWLTFMRLLGLQLLFHGMNLHASHGVISVNTCARVVSWYMCVCLPAFVSSRCMCVLTACFYSVRDVSGVSQSICACTLAHIFNASPHVYSPQFKWSVPGRIRALEYRCWIIPLVNFVFLESGLDYALQECRAILIVGVAAHGCLPPTPGLA